MRVPVISLAYAMQQKYLTSKITVCQFSGAFDYCFNVVIN